MKIFISLPMKGKTEQEILEERKRLIADIKERIPEAEIIDSYKLLKDYILADDEKNSLKFLGESIKALADADTLFLAKGWEKARGCRIERLCALEYGIGVAEIIKAKRG